ESEELFINFTTHMREQLELLASKITTVRTENLRKDKGLAASDTSNMLIDPHSFSEEIKTAKALSADFASPKVNHISSTFDNQSKSGKQDHQQQSNSHHSKGNNSGRRSHDERKNSAKHSDDDSNRGRHQSSVHRAKGRDTRRDRHFRGRSSSWKPSDQQ
ncbi:hypothetical protein BG000_004366, partial [Podila horticola]